MRSFFANFQTLVTMATLITLGLFLFTVESFRAVTGITAEQTQALVSIEWEGYMTHQYN